VLGWSSGSEDRMQRTKLEIPFGHAFDRREVSSSKSAVRACVPSVRDLPSRSAPYSESRAAQEDMKGHSRSLFYRRVATLGKTPAASELRSRDAANSVKRRSLRGGIACSRVHQVHRDRVRPSSRASLSFPAATARATC
jgi:hypothetical protein